jgi:dTDP-glucose 4,6-dehydratase
MEVLFMRILVTGGAGFIGSCFVRYLLEKYPKDEIVVLDKLTYAGRPENLQGVIDKVIFIKGDICESRDVEKAGECEVVINFAAETHVDRSIIEAGTFVRTDVFGTYNLLEYARRHGIRRYVQISTDEVYGSIKRGSFKEDDRLDPSSPYSASKAGADLLVMAYCRTYGLPVLITRSSNNYGPYQFPEKLVPVLILSAMADRPLPIYGKGENVRDWLYVMDNCEAIDLILRRGKDGEIYNVASGDERRNIEVAKLILRELRKPESLIRYVEDRPGHDFRYSLNCEKVKKLGWTAKTKLEEGLRKTIRWYKENEWWWSGVWR